MAAASKPGVQQTAAHDQTVWLMVLKNGVHATAYPLGSNVNLQVMEPVEPKAMRPSPHC